MPPRNKLGPIAESYDELQGLPLLRRAAASESFPPGAPEAILRAILQAAEVALWNLADLTGRAASDVMSGRIPRAASKLRWCRHLHAVLVLLSAVPERLRCSHGSGTQPVELHESPALQAFLVALQSLDRAVAARLDIAVALAVEEPDAEYQLLHLISTSNHESAIWEQRLSRAFVCDAARFMESLNRGIIREAVFQFRLAGDTYLMQFRAIHQAPELIAWQVNPLLDRACHAVGAGDPARAALSLAIANDLLDIMIACLEPIVDALTIPDYHRIRSNLGLTSGSHSSALHYHLLTELEGALHAAIQGSTSERTAEGILLFYEFAGFESRIRLWRDRHMHLPRKNLGAESTRSLIGSPDALEAVRKLRARSPDPPSGLAPVSDYLAGAQSLDSRILRETGRLTQSRFPDVQQRSGIFAQKSGFERPAPWSFEKTKE